MILSARERPIEQFKDLEEFYLLQSMKNMVQQAMIITFKGIDSEMFGDKDWQRLNEFCDDRYNKYKIKIHTFRKNKSYYKQRHFLSESYGGFIDINVGKWKDDNLFDNLLCACEVMC